MTNISFHFVLVNRFFSLFILCRFFRFVSISFYGDLASLFIPKKKMFSPVFEFTSGNSSSVETKNNFYETSTHFMCFLHIEMFRSQKKTPPRHIMRSHWIKWNDTPAVYGKAPINNVVGKKLDRMHTLRNFFNIFLFFF